MKLSACLVLAVFALCAFYSRTNALPVDDAEVPKASVNCEGEYDWRCPQVMCGPDGVDGVKPQDNSKPFPECCGGVICTLPKKKN